jgi:hypothetical protein
VDFSIDQILASPIKDLGSAQPLTELSTKNLPEGKGRQVHEGDKFTKICEPISTKCGSLDITKPYGPLRPVRGTALLSFTASNYKFSTNVYYLVVVTNLF